MEKHTMKPAQESRPQQELEIIQQLQKVGKVQMEIDFDGVWREMLKSSPHYADRKNLCRDWFMAGYIVGKHTRAKIT